MPIEKKVRKDRERLALMVFTPAELKLLEEALASHINMEQNCAGSVDASFQILHRKLKEHIDG